MELIVCFVAAYFVLLMLDVLNIKALKRLLLDFLIGTRNRKSAMRIHLSQPPEQRKTMAYIKPLLKDNAKAFVAFHRLYLVVRYTIIPQYAILIILNILWFKESVYPLGVCILVKIVLATFLRLQVDGVMRSKYRKGK